MYLMEIIGTQSEFLRRPPPLQLISSSAGRGVQFFWHIGTVYSSLMYSFSFQAVSQRLKTKSENALNLDEACAAAQPQCSWVLIRKLLRICFCFSFFFLPIFILLIHNSQDWSFGWLQSVILSLSLSLSRLRFLSFPQISPLLPQMMCFTLYGCARAMWLISWILRRECGLNGTVSRGSLLCCCMRVGGWLGVK